MVPWFVLAFLVGCSSQGKDRGGSEDDVTGTAILSRASSDAYECTVARSLTSYAPVNWGNYGHALTVSTSGEPFFARVETDPDDEIGPAPKPRFVVSSMGVDGGLGAPHVELDDAVGAGLPVFAATSEGFALAWLLRDDTFLSLFDSQGNVSGARQHVLGGPSGEYGSAMHLAQRGTRFGLLSQSGGSEGGLQFGVLDEEHRPDDMLNTLEPYGQYFLSKSKYVRASALSADPSGYAAVWSEDSEGATAVYFAQLNEQGGMRLAQKEIHSSVGHHAATGMMFERPTVALTPVSSGYLTAWTESTAGDSATGAGGYSVIRVGKISSEGELVGDPVSLRAVEDSVDEVEPTLVPFGDVMAVVWSHGSHIYGCAGCQPDHRLDVVLVDPDTLAPVSNVVSVEKRTDQPGGGLLRHDAVVVGDDILLAFDQQYHTSADPGSAAISCAKR